VDDRLERAMTDAYERVEHFAETHHCDFRLACYGVALERLARAYVDREIFP
jgi:glutamate dehydrogenase (NAD(P)+)